MRVTLYHQPVWFWIKTLFPRLSTGIPFECSLFISTALVALVLNVLSFNDHPSLQMGRTFPFSNIDGYFQTQALHHVTDSQRVSQLATSYISDQVYFRMPATLRNSSVFKLTPAPILSLNNFFIAFTPNSARPLACGLYDDDRRCFTTPNGQRNPSFHLQQILVHHHLISDMVHQILQITASLQLLTRGILQRKFLFLLS